MMNKTWCITRNLNWGTPFPASLVPGTPSELVCHVWFDAPIGYISIVAAALQHEQWKQWWQRPEEVQLIQFMGKDNVMFHGVLFPATLLGTGQPWTLVNSISACEYLQYEGRKFSKRSGAGVFCDAAQDMGIHADVWRFYLMLQRPEVADSDFTWDGFVEVNNCLLVPFWQAASSVLGEAKKRNLASQTLSVVDGSNHPTVALFNAVVDSFIVTMEAIRLRAGAECVQGLMRLFIQLVAEQPMCNWEQLLLCLNALYLICGLWEPFAPQLARTIVRCLNIDFGETEIAHLRTRIEAAHQVATEDFPALVHLIDVAAIAEWRERFQGQTIERQHSLQSV
eukprot:TRINITY_DN3542_c0_g1_i1.p1 TRINITY_DN3542_c0_g1~~TRINITY_DN3542_c0_g1_i1.p1  ORF type:complete len:338 (-),score=67.52 TRINITY_DN3542_c0_g1_i1:1076-2089(-)